MEVEEKRADTLSGVFSLDRSTFPAHVCCLETQASCPDTSGEFQHFLHAAAHAKKLFPCPSLIFSPSPPSLSGTREKSIPSL